MITGDDPTARIMRILGITDLEILHLAVAKGGRIDESDIAHSTLKRLGVGRLLDGLASLRDRELLKLDSGVFCTTDKARSLLWDLSTPLETRILRLLEIRSGGASYIASMLLLDDQGNDDAGTLADTLRMLQEGGYVMASTQIRSGSGGGDDRDKADTRGTGHGADVAPQDGGRPEMVYEILADGAKMAEDAGFWQARKGSSGKHPKNAGADHILGMIDDISRVISASGTISADERRVASQKISGLRDAVEKMLRRA